MNTLGERIKKQRKSLKLTQNDLANIVGVTGATISLWEKEETAPKGGSLFSLSKVLQCQPEWLLYGTGGLVEASNVTHAPPVKKMIPVISWVQAGAFCESNVLELHEVEEWLPCPATASDKAFGLRVKGDSMTSPHRGERSYPEGIVIYVDPEVDITSGRRVIAKSTSSHEATFKTYVEDNGLKYLIPINPQFPTTEITAEVAICGAIIGSYWPE
jgi:SOS-response transcriptional repressor LexA